MSGHKLDNKEALAFIFAGKSIVTFLNSESGNRFTFKITKGKDNVSFVSVLSGPENYTYMGILIDDIYKHGRKSTMSVEATSVKVFNYVLSHLKKETLPNFIEIWHEGKCGKCGLTGYKRPRCLGRVLCALWLYHIVVVGYYCCVIFTQRFLAS